eukprot:5833475-Prorocentrum_lima.AAC.1
MQSPPWAGIVADSAGDALGGSGPSSPNPGGCQRTGPAGQTSLLPREPPLVLRRSPTDLYTDGARVRGT